VIEGLNPAPMPAGQAQRIQDNLQALDEFLGQNMPEPPLLRPLQRQIERFPVQKEAPTPSQETASQPSAAPASETTLQSTPAPAERPAPAAAPPVSAPAPTVEAASPASAQDALKGIDTAIQLMRKASHFLLQQDLKDPSAYRYRRLATWSRIDELPPNKEGVTQIPPPAPQVTGPLSELRDAANWRALIETIEQQRVSQFVFWFDLHWMVAEALQQLGPDYQPALRVVCQETAYFLQRLPGVAKLAFSDETPFADAQTNDWLATIAAVDSQGGSARQSASTEDARQSVNAATQEALALARKKRVAEAVDLLFRKLAVAPSRCEQTRWRLAIVQVLMAAKRGPAALPHLEQVIADIDTFKLEQWDPELALEGLALAWKGFSSEGSKAHQDLAQGLLNRIARLNPVDALRLGF
jgi:type VI secretion system protein VasJ